MTDEASLKLETIRANVRALMTSTEAAMLSDSQYAELEDLEREVIQLCDLGDEEGARATEKVIADIINEGPTGDE